MATINTLYTKDLELDRNLKELEQRLKQHEKVAVELEKNFKDGGAGFVADFSNTLRGITDKELDRFWKSLSRANPDAMFLAACVDNMLQVLKNHDYIGSPESIVVATIECASYQMWQKIKADAWGKK